MADETRLIIETVSKEREEKEPSSPVDRAKKALEKKREGLAESGEEIRDFMDSLRRTVSFKEQTANPIAPPSQPASRPVIKETLVERGRRTTAQPKRPSPPPKQPPAPPRQPPDPPTRGKPTPPPGGGGGGVPKTASTASSAASRAAAGGFASASTAVVTGLIAVTVVAATLAAGFAALVGGAAALNAALRKTVANLQEFVPFSKELLQSQVQAELAQLQQRFELARRIGPAGSEIITVNNKLFLALQEIKVTLIEVFAPLLIKGGETLTNIINLIKFMLETMPAKETVEGLIETVKTVVTNIPLFGGMIGDILESMEKTAKINERLEKKQKELRGNQMERFMDPDNIDPSLRAPQPRRPRG